MLSTKPVRIAYCDYIAHLISTGLTPLDASGQRLLADVGRVQFDLGDYDEFISTTKTIDVEDRYGKQYRITVQEL